MDERQAIDAALTELSKVLSTDGNEPWWISTIVRPVVFDAENWNQMKARVALIKLSEILGVYLKSNNMGEVRFRQK